MGQRVHPWGNNLDTSMFPEQTSELKFTNEVGKFSKARSPFGVEDLVGLVWQYTDEFRDSHTRAVLLQGSSSYYLAANSSHWYFPKALELYTHNKYFLMSDRYERAGTIGFRCVIDTIN